MSGNSELSVTAPKEADDFRPAKTAAYLADELLAALQSEASYPNLPQELSHASLRGIDPKALTAAEKDGLRLEQAADQRLTTLLDKMVTALESRKAKLLLKGESMFTLLAKPGLKSFADARSRESGKAYSAARRELNIAKTLDQNPSAQEALDSGRINLGHVEALVRATAAQVRNGAKELSSDEQAYVVGLGEGRSESDFSTLVSQFLEGRNPLSADSEFEEARRRRFFNISYTPHGAHFKGFVDKVSAQTLREALDAASSRPDTDDDRSLTQRSADALIELASAALDAGKLKSGANVRPHISLVMTEGTFAQATKELKRRQALAKAQTQLWQGARNNSGAAPGASKLAGTGTVDDSILTLDPALLEPIAMEPAEYLDGSPVPLVELARILCDCEITRTVLGAEGLVTDLGRTTRLYTKEHRHAIISRDRSCRFEGCTTRPSRCEVHHVDWWDRDNGATSLENGVLVCKRHHTEIHEGKLEVVKDSFGLPSIVVAEHFQLAQNNRSLFGTFPPPPSTGSHPPTANTLITTGTTTEPSHRTINAGSSASGESASDNPREKPRAGAIASPSKGLMGNSPKDPSALPWRSTHKGRPRRKHKILQTNQQTPVPLGLFDF